MNKGLLACLILFCGLSVQSALAEEEQRFFRGSDSRQTEEEREDYRFERERFRFAPEREEERRRNSREAEEREEKQVYVPDFSSSEDDTDAIPINIP